MSFDANGHISGTKRKLGDSPIDPTLTELQIVPTFEDTASVSAATTTDSFDSSSTHVFFVSAKSSPISRSEETENRNENGATSSLREETQRDVPCPITNGNVQAEESGLDGDDLKNFILDTISALDEQPSVSAMEDFLNEAYFLFEGPPEVADEVSEPVALESEAQTLPFDSVQAWRLASDGMEEEEHNLRVHFADYWEDLDLFVSQAPSTLESLKFIAYDWPTTQPGQLVLRNLSLAALYLRLTFLQTVMCNEPTAYHLGVIHKYIVAGIDLDKPILNAEGDFYGNILHMALLKPVPAPFNIIESLVKGGVDVNRRDSDGETPVFAAIRRGLLPVVKLLLAYGADLQLRSPKSQFANALLFAVHHEKGEIFQFLLDANLVNVNEIDSKNRHIIDMILHKKDLAAFKAILSRPDLILKVDHLLGIIGATSKHGLIPFLRLLCIGLFSAFKNDLESLRRVFLLLIKKGLARAVRMFLELGLDTNFLIVNPKGKRFDVVCYAAMCNQVEVLDTFRRFGFQLNKLNERYFTPIMAAFKIGAMDAFRFLAPHEGINRLHLLLRLVISVDRPEFVDALIELRPDAVSCFKIHDDYLLKHAVRYGAFKIVQLLVEKYHFLPTEEELSLAQFREFPHIYEYLKGIEGV